MDQHSSPKSVEVSKELEGVCEKIARSRKASFLKAASVVRCCEADQEHMNNHLFISPFKSCISSQTLDISGFSDF